MDNFFDICRIFSRKIIVFYLWRWHNPRIRSDFSFFESRNHTLKLFKSNWLILSQFTTKVNLIIPNLLSSLSLVKEDNIGLNPTIRQENPSRQRNYRMQIKVWEQLLFDFLKGIGSIEQNSLWDNDRRSSSGF